MAKRRTLRDYLKEQPERLKQIGRGFAQVADESGTTNKANRKVRSKDLVNVKIPKLQPQKGPWMSRREERAYRTFVSVTKDKRIKIKEKGEKPTWEVQEATEAIARHELLWPEKSTPTLRVVMQRGSRRRTFAMQRFPDSAEATRDLAKYLANLLYDKKTWRDFVETIEDALLDWEEGARVIIPVDDAAYRADTEQDMG